MSRKPIRVMVVDDSAYNRRILKGMLERSKRIEVVAIARNGEEALKRVFETKPDVITLDLEMPVMDGFTFLRLITQSNPIPVIVVSSRSEDKAVFRALELGALDFIAKPSAKISSAIEGIEQELIYKVENAEAPQVRKALRIEEGRVAEAIEPPFAAPSGVAPECVVIGASTGGPTAIHYVLANLPRSFNLPIVIAQHMPPGFTAPFAERLAKRTGRTVIEAKGGDPVEQGRILLAPGGTNLELERTSAGVRTAVRRPPEGQRFIPSVDRLLSSAARAYQERLQAVVLTGMGNDGLRGAEDVFKMGGLVVAESEETAIVYGMPREVAEGGFATCVLPLPAIPKMLVNVTRGRRPDRQTVGKQA